MKKQKKPVPPAEAEPVIKKQPLLKRLLFGPEKPDLSELEAGSTTILDILSPTAIDTKSRDYIVVDGVFHAYLYITGYAYWVRCQRADTTHCWRRHSIVPPCLRHR